MIRSMTDQDRDTVIEMMKSLWPDFEGNFDLFKNHKVVVSEDNGELNGFATYSIRPWVDGANISPVPHLEGWYVKSEHRNKGVGRKLIEYVEKLCKDQGYSEMTSDALLENKQAIQAHEAIGFIKTEQIQYFRKNFNN